MFVTLFYILLSRRDFFFYRIRASDFPDVIYIWEIEFRIQFAQKKYESEASAYSKKMRGRRRRKGDCLHFHRLRRDISGKTLGVACLLQCIDAPFAPCMV